MKITITVLVLVVLAIGGLFVASKLQREETIVSARYEMLACEGCYHMTVEKSKYVFAASLTALAGIFLVLIQTKAI